MSSALSSGWATQTLRISRPAVQLSLGSALPFKPNSHSSRLNIARSRFFERPTEMERRRSSWISAVDKEPTVSERPRDDDVLPDNLADSLFQASEATILAMNRGATKCIVELLFPEFWDSSSGPVFGDEGDNLRFWKLSRRFVDNLREQLPEKRVKALFPDMGVTVMLKNQWSDVGFELGCLNSKSAAVAEDEVVVMAAPDPQGFADCRRIVDEMHESGSVILFNPRLASGDVGIGLNVRRMRNVFLGQFVIVYSLRPIGDIGSVFRKFPQPWLVFIADESMPGRYKKIAEQSSRPEGDALDAILQEGMAQEKKDGEETSESGFVDSITLPIRSFQRFMKSLM